MMCKPHKLIAMLVLLAVVPMTVRANQYGDVVVTASSPPSLLRSHGYSEYRVSVTNHSSSQTHLVTLSLPAESYAGGVVRRTISVQPSSTVNISMYESMVISGQGLRVEIDGRLQLHPVEVNLGGYRYDARPLLLLSKGATSRAFETHAAKYLKVPTGTPMTSFATSSGESFVANRSETPVGEWSPNWLGYSCFDGVVLTADEMRTAPEPVFSALSRYVECGGALMVIGSWQVPQYWRTENQQQGSLRTYTAGFGVCMVSENGVVDGLPEANWQSIGNAWDQSQSPWKAEGWFDPENANNIFPVTENVNVPVRGLLLIMLAFVILIGPVNLLVLSKKKKRMWLLWTVPAISLLTCIAVSAFSLFSEGWSGRARYWSFTILDERTHRAMTIGFNAFYAPVTPGDGLRYSVETEVTPQAERWDFSRGSGISRVADWTEDQHLETGWVTARTPAHFMIRRSETRRERLTVTRTADGSLSAVNGLGVPIRSLRLADDKGVIYQGSNIEPGASINLQKTTERPAQTNIGVMRNIFASNWASLVEPDVVTPELQPRTYIAELDRSPFLEEGLKGVKKKQSAARVYGIMKGPGDEN